MSYASPDDIEDEFKKLDLGAANVTLDTTKVQKFLDESDAEINTFLSGRYTTPITGVESLLFVKKIEIDLVAYRIAKILKVKVPVSDPAVRQDILEGFFYKEAVKKLKALRDGKLNLSDAPKKTSALTRSYTRTNNEQPRIKKDDVQW